MAHYWTGTGQKLENVHAPSDECMKYGCPIHKPSDHHMKDWPTHWREDRGIMERLCEHDVGHPDPDQVAYMKRHHGVEEATMESMHGCDGCCAKPKETT